MGLNTLVIFCFY